MNGQTDTLTCTNCGEAVSPRAIACKHCGTLLRDVGTSATQTIMISRPKATDELPDDAFQTGTTQLSDRGIIYLSIERVNTPVARYVKNEEVILGRMDKDDTAKLGRKDVNLSPYNGHERGVSRRHARIYRKGDSLYLEDLGSSNGTALNGEALLPGESHKLRDGDEIMLGRMMVWINF